MAGFVAALPLEVVDPWGHSVEVERGFLIAGGVDPGTGAVLDDVWLFDATNLGVQNRPEGGDPAIGCPWISLVGGLPEGIFDGFLYWEDSGQRFVLVGGTGQDALGNRSARDHALRLDPSGIAAGTGFAPVTVRDRVPVDGAYHFEWYPDPLCIDPPLNTCWSLDSASCEPLTTCAWDPCSNAPVDPSCCVAESHPDLPVPGNFLLGCIEDPECHPDADLDGVVRAEVFAPGGAQMAGAYDPVSDTLSLHGGTTACVQAGCDPMGPIPPSCAPWAALIDADRAERCGGFALANRAQLVRYAGGTGGLGGVPLVSAPSLDVVRPPGWPVDSSWGLRQAAAVHLGLDWDFALRGWARSVPGEPDEPKPLQVLVGGTVSQQLAPATTHELLETDEADDCDGPLYNDGSWLPDPVSDADSGASDAVLGLLGSSYELMSLLPQGMRGAAAVRVQPDALLIAGGRGLGSGPSDELMLYDDYGVEPYLVGDVGPRFGAGLAYDPVGQVAYLYGGSELDAGVTEIRSQRTTHPNASSVFDVDSGELELVFVPDVGTPGDLSAGRWEAEVAWELTHHCTTPQGPLVDAQTLDDAVSGCWADELTVYVPIEHDPAGVQLTIDMGTYAGPLTVLLDDVVVAGGKLVALRYRLPQYLADGDALTVIGTVPLLPVSEAHSTPSPAAGAPTCGAQSGYLECVEDVYGLFAFPYGAPAAPGDCPTAQGFQLSGLPLVPDLGGGVAEAFYMEWPLGDIRVLPPPGFGVLAPGQQQLAAPGGLSCSRLQFDHVVTRDDELPGSFFYEVEGTCFALGATETVRMNDAVLGLHLVMLETLEERAQFAERGTVFEVHVDRCLRPAATADVDAHLLGGVQADVAELVARMGPSRLSSAKLALVRPPEGLSGVGGVSWHGVSISAAFEPSGALLTRPPDYAVGSSLPPVDYRAVLVHEAVHQWVGVGRTLSGSTEWLREAFPTLVETVLYPSSGDSGERLFRGVTYIVGSTFFAGGIGQDLEQHADLSQEPVLSRQLRDFVGPYTLAQLHHASLTSSARLDADVWAEWAALWAAGPLHGLLSEADVRASIAGPHGLPQFYDEWVEGNRVGTPLLGLERFVWDPGGSPPRTEAVVRQVQVAGLGWPRFTDAPFYLGCTPVADDTLPAFDLCGATKVGLTGHPPMSMGGMLDHPIALVPEPGLPAGMAPMPAWVGLLANHNLLPERVPFAEISDGVSPRMYLDTRAAVPTWTVHPAAVVPGATADGDGYPPASDCDPGDGAYHPGAPDPPGGGRFETNRDYNCDGWPAEECQLRPLDRVHVPCWRGSFP